MDPQHWARVISRNVRECRAAAGLTQAKLAAELGTSVPSVSRLERGRHLPSLTTLLRVAEAVGVEPCRLLTPPDSPAADPPKKGRGRK